MYYNRFRYYDPEQGNYTQIDPIGLAGGNPTLYGYVDDPNSLVDIFGLSQTYWLAKNMAIDQRPVGEGQTAHHIVPLKSNTKYAKLSRPFLTRNNLNPDIAANGARLWGTASTQKAKPAHPGKAVAVEIGNYHAGVHIHSPQNDKLIYKILRNAEKKGLDIENILTDIGRRMESGKWKNSIKCH